MPRRAQRRAWTIELLPVPLSPRTRRDLPSSSRAISCRMPRTPRMRSWSIRMGGLRRVERGFEGVEVVEGARGEEGAEGGDAVLGELVRQQRSEEHTSE